MSLASLTRRRFLKTMAGGAGVLLAHHLTGCASCPPAIAPARPGRRVFADLHLHCAMNEWLGETPAGVESPELLGIARTEFNPTRFRWEHLHQAGVDLVCAAHFNVFDEWLSMPTDPSAEAPRHTLRMLDHLERILAGPARPYARLVRNAEDLRRALKHRPGDPEYRVAVIHTLEGGHALGGDPDQVAAFARRGVALITVTHFFDKGLSSAPNAYPFFPDANTGWAPRGLTGLGEEVIRRMEASGVLVDVTHMTDRALNDVFRVAGRPLVATHAGPRALSDHPYNLHDEHLQEIAGRGGLIGVILYPHVLANYADEEAAREHGSLRDVVHAIRHVIEVCGDHRRVAVGSDFSGFIQGPRDLPCLGQIDRLRALLVDEFGDPDMVEDILAGNGIEFLLRYWGEPG